MGWFLPLALLLALALVVVRLLGSWRRPLPPPGWEGPPPTAEERAAARGLAKRRARDRLAGWPAPLVAICQPFVWLWSRGSLEPDALRDVRAREDPGTGP